MYSALQLNWKKTSYYVPLSFIFMQRALQYVQEQCFYCLFMSLNLASQPLALSLVLEQNKKKSLLTTCSNTDGSLSAGLKVVIRAGAIYQRREAVIELLCAKRLCLLQDFAFT